MAITEFPIPTATAATVAETGDSDDLSEGVTNLLLTSAERAKIAATSGTNTGDMSDGAVETAYNNQVAVMSQAAAEAGVSTVAQRVTPERIKQAIVALGPDIAIEEEGSEVIAALARLNFVGPGVTVSDAGGNEATVTIPAAATQVDSFEGRTGVVTATAGDYAASEVTNDSGVTGTNVDDALNNLAVGAASSIDSELALFSSTTGKLLKRAVGTGIMKVASGVSNVVSRLAALSELPQIAQHSVLARITAGSGNVEEVTSAGLTEEATPASGDWLMGFLSTGDLRKFDVGNLPGHYAAPVTKGTTYVAVAGDFKGTGAPLLVFTSGNLTVNTGLGVTAGFSLTLINTNASVLTVGGTATLTGDVTLAQNEAATIVASSTANTFYVV